MSRQRIDYKNLCMDLLRAESESEVTALLARHGFLDAKYWKVLGGMPNNRAMVDNQQQDPAGALVEKVVNGIDAMLIKECFLAGTNPDSSEAPREMATAAELFFRVKEGNLANLLPQERTKLAENIALVVTGSKSAPCYLVVDKGEGQTPFRFEDTFLSLVRANKARIPFVQGKYNCGGTGVLPFCGKQAYELIISRRCPKLPSGASLGGGTDDSHDLWGFTLIRRLLPSQGVFDTPTYVYLVPEGVIPAFKADEVPALPEVSKERLGDETETETAEVEDTGASRDGIPRPYAKGIPFGTVIKLYDYQWQARTLATTEARFALERYLHRLCLPFRIVETRPGWRAHYFATTVSGTAVTISDDKGHGYLENGFPLEGQISPDGIGTLPTSVALYRESSKNLAQDEKESQRGKRRKRNTKDPRRLAKGLSFTINGQVHYAMGPEFFVTRGLNYDYLRDTIVVTIDCTGLHEDVRGQLIMPSRDRLRKLPEFEILIDGVVSFLKDCRVLREMNDERRLRRVKAALEDDATQDVFQSLVDKDPILAQLFQGGGLQLRNPWGPGPKPQKYQGKLPPTFFHFEGGKHAIQKSFAIDRTCAVELQTNALNGYFHLPDPQVRGALDIQPQCFVRWNLFNGILRVVFRAPSNAQVGDSVDATITVTDPCMNIQGRPPWVNTVRLAFAPGGKVVKSGGEKKRQNVGGALGLPNITLVQRDQWEQHAFNEHSGLRITKEDGNYRFWVNMDNIYLQNELLRRKDAEKEAAKFAYKWGLVLVSLGMLQELKKQQARDEKDLRDRNGGDDPPEPGEAQVSRFSGGVAAVIIPTILHLMDAMKEATPVEETAA